MKTIWRNRDAAYADLIKPLNPVLTNREFISRQRFKNGKSDTATFLTSNRSLLSEDVRLSMSSGSIPDLESFCNELLNTFTVGNYPFNALQFIPVLSSLTLENKEETERFIANPIKKYVLIKNDLIKVVLIHWEHGDYTEIHGHDASSGIFKILKGRLEEKRYSTRNNPTLLSSSKMKKGSVGYIDDTMAFHAVGNPFKESAISLHVYTPGLRTIPPQA